MNEANSADSAKRVRQVLNPDGVTIFQFAWSTMGDYIVADAAHGRTHSIIAWQPEFGTETISLGGQQLARWNIGLSSSDIHVAISEGLGLAYSCDLKKVVGA